MPTIEKIMLDLEYAKRALPKEEYALLIAMVNALCDATAAWAVYHKEYTKLLRGFRG